MSEALAFLVTVTLFVLFVMQWLIFQTLRDILRLIILPRFNNIKISIEEETE